MFGDPDRPRGGWPDRFSGEPPEAPEKWITDSDARNLDTILDDVAGILEWLDEVKFETQFAGAIGDELAAAVRALDALTTQADEIRSEAVTD
jgi:hypothetical protein